MNKNKRNQTGPIQLYNPKSEGIGAYDIHYINAYRKDRRKNSINNKPKTKRVAA
tara:strand:- start:173 stop:334 length:162 start_codon:yes stop_codon:yes gene_type:complete